MAIRLPDNSIQLSDGRRVYANSLVVAQDLCELVPILCPQVPTWPIAHGRGVGFIGAVGVGVGAGVGGGPGGGGGGGGGSGGGSGSGPQGATGFQGSSGPQGFQGPGGGPPGSDIFAATRVVSLTPGDGTDLTIASALAALPPEGGKVFVKQGTYAVAATLAVPAAPVVVEGAGEGTIINLGSNAIAAFTLAAGAKLQLRNMLIQGDGTAGQEVVHFGGGNDLTMQTLRSDLVEVVINAVGANATITAYSTRHRLPDGAGSLFLKSGSLSEMSLVDVVATAPNGASGGFLGSNPNFTHAINCEFSVANGFDLLETHFYDCIVRSQLSPVFANISGPAIFIGCRIEDVQLNVTGGVESRFAECEIGDFDGVNPPIILSPSSTHSVISNNAFLMTAGVFAARIRTSDCTVTGNTGCKIQEFGSANNNRYSNNIGFGGSVITGGRSLVENENFRNVRTWGAFGNGSTDDTAAIQSAIDALPADGGVLFFPPGRYLISASLSLPNKPVIIKGSGAGNAFIGASGTVIDVAANVISAFNTAAGGFFQEYIFQNLSFFGSLLAGQNVVSDSVGAFVTLEECQIIGFDRVFDAAAAMEAIIKDSLIFTANALLDGAGSAGSILKSEDLVAFLNGPVGIGLGVVLVFTDTNLNSFGAFTVDVGSFSTVEASRFAGATVTVAGGECRFNGFASDSGLLDLNSNNNVVDGCLIENAAVGVQLEGQRNIVSSTRFNGVGVPINEVGAADFNLFDAINGFAGSVVIGANSVTGTVIP